jgi:hypothetical protein
MLYYDNQASVLDIFVCRGVFFVRQYFKHFLLLSLGGTGEEDAYSLGPFEKNLILSMDSFKRLLLSHMEMKTDPLFERL